MSTKDDLPALPDTDPGKEECEMRFVLARVDILTTRSEELKMFYFGVYIRMRELGRFTRHDMARLRNRANELLAQRVPSRLKLN